MKTLFAVLRYAFVIVLMSPLFVISSPIHAVEIIDTGALLGESAVIRWMDNQRIMFLAASGQTCDRKDKPDSYKQPLNQIALFDTQTRQMSWYGEKGIHGLCYANGNVSYAQRKVTDGLCTKDEWSYLRGKFGEEKALPGVALDVFSCLPETEVRANPTWLVEAEKTSRRSELSSRTWLDEANKPPGRIFKPLKPEHGWLEFVGGDRGFFDQAWYPVAIHQPGKEDKGIPIDPDVFQPWLDQGYHVVFLRYEAFRDAYLLALDDTWSAVDGKTGKLWWLYPDGRIEEIVTYGHEKNWKNVRMNGLVPAKFNLLTTLSDTNRSSAKSGLYRQTTNGDLELLAKGWVGGGKSLSPDGCKMAYGIDPRGFWADGPKRYYLQVLDLCQSSK